MISPTHICLVSAVFGGIDALPVYGHSCASAVFTEANIPNGMPADLSDRMRGKFVKSHMHAVAPGYAGYVWADASVKFKTDSFLSTATHAIAQGRMCMLEHPFTRTISAEIGVLLAHANTEYLRVRYASDKLAELAEFFKQENVPAHAPVYGLYAFGIPNTPRHSILMDTWWELMQRFGTDQTLMSYLIWKHKLPVTVCSRDFVRQNLEKRPHLKMM